MDAKVRWLVIFSLFTAFSTIFGESNYKSPFQRFEYKYSFKPPYLAQKDGTVPFWEYGGNAIASAENVRIAPSMRSQKGGMWTKNTIPFKWWKVELVFRISGRGRIGADGLAFWYTSSKGAYDGTVFGSSDQWNGLGLFFDSFDNDNQHNNPYIMAVLNNGTQNFDHANDGFKQMLAGCLRDFRNKPFPTRTKIEYYQNTLTVLFHNGMTNNDKDYEMCFRAENILLPEFGYFGVSAATGGLADDHDVINFLTTSLQPPSQIPMTGQKVSTEEEAKLNKEYQEYQTKLEKQKQQYRKEHPDEHKSGEDFEEYYESDNQRELRQIFSVQSQIFDNLRGLEKKLDEVVGRQERTLSLMSQIQIGGMQAVAGGQQGQPMPLIDTIRRHEVDAVLNNQNLILSTSREIKSFIGDVHSKAEAILNHQARAPTAQVQPIGYDYQSLISEIRESLNVLKRDVNQLNTKGSSSMECPNPNCLTSTMFLLFMAVQMIILFGYSLYRDNKEAKAKKFY